MACVPNTGCVLYERLRNSNCHTAVLSEVDFFFFFCWHYSLLWALACWTIPLHWPLSITNFLHLLTPNTWRSPSTSSLHPFLGLPLVPSSSWVKITLSNILQNYGKVKIFVTVGKNGSYLHKNVHKGLNSGNCFPSRLLSKNLHFKRSWLLYLTD